MLSESEKSALLSNRNLLRYCNQCVQAKAAAERRMAELGGPDFGAAPRDAPIHGTALRHGEMVLRLSEILSDGLALSYFCQYLAKFHDDINLKFWLSIQGMRVVRAVPVGVLSNGAQELGEHGCIDPGLPHELFEMYYCNPSVQFLPQARRPWMVGQLMTCPQIDKATVAAMRATANSFKAKPKHIVVTKDDVASFLQAQQQVADWLQVKHYRSFLLSDYYRSSDAAPLWAAPHGMQIRAPRGDIQGGQHCTASPRRRRARVLAVPRQQHRGVRHGWRGRSERSRHVLLCARARPHTSRHQGTCTAANHRSPQRRRANPSC